MELHVLNHQNGQKKYQVSGTIQLPYAEINEPFVAYFDETKNKSRMDSYGIETVYQFGGKVGKNLTFGVAYKIAFMANDTLKPQKTCFQTNGTNTSTINPQALLPNISIGFKQLASQTVNGKNVTVWQNITIAYGRKNTYTMYIEKATNSPVRYEMFGYNTLTGSHYDKYYIDYHDYKKGFKDTVFNLPKGLKCSGYPGPGDEEQRILMNPMAEYTHNDDKHVHVMFDKFKKKHNKVYRDVHEEEKRKVHFRDNIRFVHSTNRAGKSYKVALNHMADLSSGELALMRGRKHSHGYNGGLPFLMENYKGAYIPDHIDWRNYGAVTQVKDQGMCGSCWSFGSTGVIEGAFFLKNKKLVRLSQQQLMDCSWGEGNNACDGGEDFRSYQWIMKHKGLASEEDYGKYLAADGKCHSKNITATATIKGYVNVTSGDAKALRIAIAKHGPISVGIDASHKSLSFYSNGVYYEPKCGNKQDDLDHAVLAVGYGVQNMEPYWLIKNSWSTYWGNNGYVLMSQKDNNCGVTTDATFVIM